MKVQINLIDIGDEEEIILNIHEVDEQISKALELMTGNNKNKKIAYVMGKREDSHYKINLNDIYYIESLDRKVFIYTKKDVYETMDKLYELEESLEDSDFVRVSKSMILNLDKIHSFSPKISGNLEALLINQEKVNISRRYVQAVKVKLGMKEGE